MSVLRLLSLALLGCTLAAGAQEPIRLRVDLTDAPRHLLHVTELLPVHPGQNSFSYPEWIPSQELPGGPIDNLTGLVFRAGDAHGPALRWRRDLVDLHAFHVDVPSGATTIAAAYVILEVPSRFNTIGTNRTSSHVVMLEPSDIVLYPSGVPARTIPVSATIHLPSGWVAATALRSAAGDAPALNPPDATFRTVSLEQFVDSPILAGDHCRQYPLAPEIHPAHTLDVCAEKPDELNLQPELLAHMSTLVRQATALFRGHHYAHYDFLIADSPHLTGDSAEHTESADYVVKTLKLSDPSYAQFLGYLLPHEFTHSWCGKYRRPVGDAIPDFNTPMQNDLLWVYEGLTEYYGDVLAARSGLRTPEEAVAAFNYAAYDVDQPGRRWRPVQDTADASSILRGNDSAWASWRLGQNYYHEGALLWLEADVKIRQLSGGHKSLDDFAALFFGDAETGPGVSPYTFTDLTRAMNQTAAYDWQEFWTTRLQALTDRPPTAGLEGAGYTYTDGQTMSKNEADLINGGHLAEHLHSIGIFVLPDGTLLDVWIGSPAYAAGLGPGDKLTLVNGKPYTPDALTTAIREAKKTAAPITLTALRDEETAVYRVDYHSGERYAVLLRNNGSDLLTGAILRTKP